jgi:hypothetical protein
MRKASSQSPGGTLPKGQGKAHRPEAARLALAAIGMEAEFTLFVDGEPVRPEDLFADPRAFVRGRLLHRVGTSYHLPTGGAVYFDTGVIEVATPVIEIERGCAERAGRSLWESILFLRGELDAWDRRTGRDSRLAGFSAHYNVSFELPAWQQGAGRTVHKLALLLSYLLPAPVMLLATNRRSTGVGVRPRGDRIEVTADFTPSPSLMIATAALLTGIVRKVMTWPSFELDVLERTALPVILQYAPMPHTSRKGWLARYDRYPRNPFTEDVNAPLWEVRLGTETRTLALREIAARIFRHFRPSILRLSSPFTFRLLSDVLYGRAPSLLDLPDRPEAYEDVGRLCLWDNLFPEAVLARSRYERIIIRAVSGQHLHLQGQTYQPVGLRGWTEVVFRRTADHTRHVFSFDYLLQHLDDWERLNVERGNVTR